MAQALHALMPRAPEPTQRAARPGIAPTLTVLAFGLPILAGLVGTLLPAFGYLPAIGGVAISVAPWRALLDAPGFATALQLTLVTGWLAALLSLMLALGIVAFVHHRAWAFRLGEVLAPNAKLRSRVVPQGPPAQAPAATETPTGGESEVQTVQARTHRINWARLLKRVFDIDMRHCPNCGGELKIVAAILERSVIETDVANIARNHRQGAAPSHCSHRWPCATCRPDAVELRVDPEAAAERASLWPLMDLPGEHNPMGRSPNPGNSGRRRSFPGRLPFLAVPCSGRLNSLYPP